MQARNDCSVGFRFDYLLALSIRPVPFSIGFGLITTAFLVLSPPLAGQALAFLVFVRNVGDILGITIGTLFAY